MDTTREIAKAWKAAMDKGMDKVILLCDSRLRAPLSAMLSRTVQMLPVIAYDEIVPGIQVEPVETISIMQNEVTATNEQEQLTPALAV
jgi:flagellar biosynthesis protein FlhA